MPKEWFDPITQRMQPWRRIDLVDPVYRQAADRDSLAAVNERLTVLERRGA